MTTDQDAAGAGPKLRTLTLEDGKYELRHDEASGALCAYRYGEPWQDFTGNKFMYLLMSAALAERAVPQEPVATVFRGGTAQFGQATILQSWQPGADRLPLGEHKLYAAAPAREAHESSWIGCGDCDVIFGCHNGKAACIRNPAPAREAVALAHMQIVLLWGHRSDGPSNTEIVSFARLVIAEFCLLNNLTPPAAATGEKEPRT